MCDLNSDWNNLPDVAMIEVYKYLNYSDRAAACRVCKNWNRLFETPLLWRYRCVSFGGFDAVSIAENSIKYLKRFGKHLQTLAVRFQGPTYRTVKVIAQATELFLKHLSYSVDIKLKEFTIFHANMEHYWHLNASRNRVVSALCRFLRRCRNLELLNIIAARLTLVDGCRVLESLGRGAAKKTLKVLYMEDMFQTNLVPVSHRRYINAISKIKGLTYLYTNYNTVSGEVLRSLSYSQQVNKLTLTIDNNITNCIIPSEDWAIFRDSCPSAEVIFYLYASGFRYDIRPALTPTIPMKEIDIVAWPALIETSRGEANHRLSVLLHHIANSFHRTLENFNLHLDRNPPVDDEILYFLCKCSRVKELSLYCRMSVNTVERICKLQHDGRINLRSLNLGVLGLDESEWKHLCQVRTQLIENISKRDNNVVITSEIESEEEEEETEESDDEDDSDEELFDLFSEEDEEDEDVEALNNIINPH